MSRPIRVLQVVTQMNRGGLENRLMDIYQSIDRDIIQFDFYTNRMTAGVYDSEITELGGRVYRSNPISLLLNKKVDEFSRFLMEHPEYKIVHIHLNELSSPFCIAAKKAGISTRIVHSRGSGDEGLLRRFYKSLVKKSIPNNATHLFAVSELAGRHLFGDKKFNAGDVKVLPNAIDCSRYRFNGKDRRETRYRLKCSDDLVLLHVGNLRRVKNQSFTLDVFSEVRRQNPKVLLLFAGDGPDRKRLETKASNLGLADKVLFLGSCSNIEKLLSAADVFVFPSLHEGFPGALLEAQANGLPCIASSNIAPEAFIADNCARLSLGLSVREWSRNVLSLASGTHADNYDLLCKAGYERRGMADWYCDFYSSMLA